MCNSQPHWTWFSSVYDCMIVNASIIKVNIKTWMHCDKYHYKQDNSSHDVISADVNRFLLDLSSIMHI